MKELFIWRHAKSAWEDLGIEDFERPLNKRGLRTAPKVAQWFVETYGSPDLILCSPAERAVGTLHIGEEAGITAGHTVLVDQLYLAAMADLLQLLGGVTPEIERVMLIGHNPGLQQLVLALCQGEEPAASFGLDLRQIAGKFPTAALAHIRLDIDNWADIAPFRGKLYVAVSPKVLKHKGTPPHHDPADR